MIKKILITLVMIIAVSSLTGCMAPAAAATPLEVSSEMPEPATTGYEKNLEGLVSYLKDSQLITGDGTEMSFDFIGAKAGKKFAYSYGGGNISCEIYEYDTASENDIAKDIFASIKEKGSFTSLDKEIHAQLSNNNQFMMALVVNGENEETKVLQAKLEEKFKNFA